MHTHIQSQAHTERRTYSDTQYNPVSPEFLHLISLFPEVHGKGVDEYIYVELGHPGLIPVSSTHFRSDLSKGGCHLWALLS